MQVIRELSNRNRKKSILTIAKKSRRSKSIVLFGASQCGKSAFLRRLLYDKFNDTYTPTIEDYHEHCHIYNNHAFNLEFVDTGGPFEFPAMRDMNILRAHVAMVMYDVNNEDSMKVVATILSIISQLRGPENPLHCIFVGNKIDLYKGDDVSDIYRILDGHIAFYPNWINYHHLVSSRLGENVRESLQLALDRILLTTPEDCFDVSTYREKWINCFGIRCCNKHTE